MRMGRTLIMVGCVATLSGLAHGKKTEDKKAEPKPDPMMAAMAKYMAPGPQHKLLQSWVGTWNVSSKFFMEPGKPPTESHGTMEVKPVGDLWITEELKADYMGKPFSGHGVDGYDLTKSKYVGTWVDSMGSYVMHAEGSADASGKVITYTANDFDPMTGKTGTVKQVTKIESDKQHTMSMWKTMPDGKETKMMEIVYTRK